MLIYVTLACCALVAVLLILRYDLYDKEPWPLVVVAVVAGAVVMLGLSFVEDLTLSWLRAARSSATPSFVAWAAVAATHEELARLAIVAGFALLCPRYFNDPMDGVVYGALAGLGMALEESVAHVVANTSPGTYLPAGELVRIFCHTVLGGLVGFPVGLARRRVRSWPLVLIVALALAMGLHFAWDWLSLEVAAREAASSLLRAAVIGVLLVTTIAFGLSVVAGSRLSRETFAPRTGAAQRGVSES